MTTQNIRMLISHLDIACPTSTTAEKTRYSLEIIAFVGLVQAACPIRKKKSKSESCTGYSKKCRATAVLLAGYQEQKDREHRPDAR